MSGRSEDAASIIEAVTELVGGAAIVVADSERRVVFSTPNALERLNLDDAQVAGLSMDEVVRRTGCEVTPSTVRSTAQGWIALRLDPPEAKDDFEQLLRFASDLASSRANERDRNDQLAKALADLRAARTELNALRRQLHVPDDLAAIPVDVDDGGIEEFHGLVSGDVEMKRLFETVRQVARTRATVLINGETGTGKELVAASLHEESDDCSGPFVAINCAALSPSLAESQLFGHAKGAFTGAMNRHDGVFKRADGGTLFLDEIAELPLELQSKLLRALQERTILPVGAQTPVPVELRVIAATHRDLLEEVRRGRFREDLYYRLQVVTLRLPPLRERGSDLERLVRHFLGQAALRQGGPDATPPALAPAAVRALLRHTWPGNVRELENAIEAAAAVCGEGVIRLHHLPPNVTGQDGDAEVTSSASPSPAPERAAAPDAPAAGKRPPPQQEEAAIREALRRTDGAVNEAARLVGMSRATFHRKRRKYGIPVARPATTPSAYEASPSSA